MNKEKRRYIIIRIINAFLAALISFITSFADYRVTKTEILLIIIISFGVLVTGLKDIVEDELDLYKMRQAKVLNFF